LHISKLSAINIDLINQIILSLKMKVKNAATNNQKQRMNI